MAAPNIVNVTAIYGKTALQAVTTTATAILTNSAGSGKVLKVNALYAANVNTGANNTVTIDVYRSATAYRIGAAIVVPIAATLDVLSNSIYLEEGDSLRLTANANSKIEAVCSYEDIS